MGWLKGDSSSVTRWVHPSVETFTAQAQKLASKILEKPRTMPIMVIEKQGLRMMKHLNLFKIVNGKMMTILVETCQI